MASPYHRAPGVSRAVLALALGAMLGCGGESKTKSQPADDAQAASATTGGGASLLARPVAWPDVRAALDRVICTVREDTPMDAMLRPSVGDRKACDNEAGDVLDDVVDRTMKRAVAYVRYFVPEPPPVDARTGLRANQIVREYYYGSQDFLRFVMPVLETELARSNLRCSGCPSVARWPKRSVSWETIIDALDEQWTSLWMTATGDLDRSCRHLGPPLARHHQVQAAACLAITESPAIMARLRALRGQVVNSSYVGRYRTDAGRAAAVRRKLFEKMAGEADLVAEICAAVTSPEPLGVEARACAPVAAKPPVRTPLTGATAGQLLDRMADGYELPSTGWFAQRYTNEAFGVATKKQGGIVLARSRSIWTYQGNGRLERTVDVSPGKTYYVEHRTKQVVQKEGEPLLDIMAFATDPARIRARFEMTATELGAEYVLTLVPKTPDLVIKEIKLYADNVSFEVYRIEVRETNNNVNEIELVDMHGAPAMDLPELSLESLRAAGYQVLTMPR